MRVGFTLFGIEETTEVAADRLHTWLSVARMGGGRLRRSAPITMPDGSPGYAITMAYRGDPIETDTGKQVAS